MLFLGLAFIGLPGTNGFIGEFLILLGAFRAHWALAAVAVLGVILGAAYFLWYYERAFFGPAAPGPQKPLRDLQPREWGIAAALSVMVLWIGLYPAPFLNMINGSLQKLVERVAQGSTHPRQAQVLSRPPTPSLPRQAFGPWAGPLPVSVPAELLPVSSRQ